MRIEKRKTGIFFLGVLIALICGIWSTHDVQAASAVVSCSGITTHVGKYWITTESNGKIRVSSKEESSGKVLVKPAAKESFGGIVFSDGTNVFYSATENGSAETKIYRITIKSKVKKCVMSYPASYGCLLAYNRKRIVLGKQFENNWNLYAYTPANKELVSLKALSIGMRQYGKNLIYDDLEKEDQKYVTAGVYTYNLDTGKSTCISKKTLNSCVRILGGKVYYREHTLVSKNTYQYTLKSCSVSGQNKKKLGSIKVKYNSKSGTVEYPGFAVEFFKTYAMCHYLDGDDFYCWRLDYSTKKFKKMSYEDFTAKLTVSDAYTLIFVE